MASLQPAVFANRVDAQLVEIAIEGYAPELW